MPQSLSNVLIHATFSTKHRKPLINEELQSDLNGYIGGTLKGINCPPIIVNGVEDHIHGLYKLSRTITIAKSIEEIKKESSKWIKKQVDGLHSFSWQNGYAAFSVSESKNDHVIRYIKHQKEHHKTKTFKEELLQLLEKHNVDYDDQYLWN